MEAYREPLLGTITMNRLKLYPEQYFLLMGKEQQHAYLLRVRKLVEDGDGQNSPCWLYFVMDAYFTGNTVEIVGTPMMSTYRDVLLNQLLP